MTTSIEQRQQALLAEIAQVRATIAGIEGKLREKDSELAALSGQRDQFLLLGDICDSLDKLEGMGASALFWGELPAGFDPEQQLQRVRALAGEFREKLGALEQGRDSLRKEIQRHHTQIDVLSEHLEEVREAMEAAKFDFVVEREERERPFRPAILPWATQGEDRRRLRKALLIALLMIFLIGGLPLVWTVPPPDKNKPVEVPERLAQMVKKKVPPKPPEPIKEAKKEEEKPDENKPKKDEPKPKDTPKPTPVEKQQARAVAETKGVLAFKNTFSDMMDDMPSELGSDAPITNATRQNAGGAAGTRSLIVAQASGGSGGIASANVSRGGVGNGSGGAIAGSGVAVTRAQSSISADMKEDRPLTKGAGPARTDEEIQIVFDKYKSALYRIYNRELRNDPTLRGKMVLQITIEPDGHVSACKVQSTDMNSPALSADIIDRVLKFNFGAKEGVPSTKILYPIDFLPAS